ncbi:MAG: hypothetical protein ABMA15_16445 [Vicinamibacterales bacterium]
MASSASSNTSQRGLVWLFAFLIPFAALAVHQWSWGPPALDGDYAQYLLHAKAIIEGRPYSDTGYIFHRDAWSLGPRAYPPGLPLTLVPIVAVAGIHSPLFRLLMIGSTLAFAYLAWRRLAAFVEPWQAAVGAGFAAFVIESHWGLLDPISDPGFAALAWGMILAVDLTTPWSWRRIVTVTLLGGGVLSYRMAGVALIGAFLLCVLARWPKHGGRAAIPLVLWTLGGVGFLLAGLQVGDLLSLLTGWRGVTANLEMISREYGPSLVVAMLRPTPYLFINRAYYLLGAIVSLVGLAHMTRHAYRSFLAVGCTLYVLMLVIAPVGEERYLWPLYPVAACALAVGLTHVLQSLQRFWPSLPARGVAVAILAVVATAALGTEMTRARPDTLVGTPDGEALFSWLRDAQRATPIRVVVFNPRVVTLETGVPSMGNLERSARGQMRAFADEGITHLIRQLGAVSDRPQQVANSLPERYPDRFALAYQNSRFQVYHVLPGELRRRRGSRGPS